MERRVAIMSIAILSCAALSACGTTGKTTRFVLDLELGQIPQIASEIRVQSVGMEAEAAQLIALNVQPWGKFDQSDLRNIELSLRETLLLNTPPAQTSAGKPIQLHLVIRRYIVSVSNTSGAVLAAVAWAMTDARGELIFEEQFYASKATYLVGTIGSIKNSAHHAIVRRIATMAVKLASGSMPTEQHAAKFEETTLSLDEAAARLPDTMVSMGNPSLAAFPDRTISAVGLLLPSGVSTIEWKSSGATDQFDWQGYLANLSTISE